MMKTGYVIRAEDPETVSGEFLQFYDPDIRCIDDPRVTGYAKWTKNPLMAIVYKSRASAMAEWLRVSRTVPLRSDGKPNRPLSYFTITVLPLTEAVEQGRES